MGTIAEAWEGAKKFEKHLNIQENYELFQMDFWAITKEIQIDIEEGKKRKKEGRIDNSMIEDIRYKYKLSDNCITTYIDGSKREGGKSVGIGLAIVQYELGYNLSINKKYSIFTAEVLAVSEALKKL